MPNCYVTQDDCKTELGKKLQAFRADRPDEWTMDEFIRAVEQLYTEADLQEMLKVSFVTGYELGHNDTVESQYTDAEDRYEDSKDDIIELIKQRISNV